MDGCARSRNIRQIHGGDKHGRSGLTLEFVSEITSPTSDDKRKVTYEEGLRVKSKYASREGLATFIGPRTVK